MLDLDIGKAVEGITNVIGQFVEDKDERKKIEAELTKAIKSGDIELKKLEMETEKLKANDRLKVLERLPIPMIYYTFLIVIINNSIIAPYIEAFSTIEVPILPMDDSLYSLIGWITGGLLTKKVADKSPLVTSTLNNIFKKSS